MTAARFTTLDEYLASLDSVRATTLRRVITSIQESFPDLTVKIAWNVPHLQRPDGKYVFGTNAAKNHLTLAPWSNDVFDTFRDRLAGYTLGKGTFQVPVDWDVDADLLHDMVAARLTELDG